ncbi:hypothetical protein BR93DRAFT_655509 [Coniochaeta sp. PMI_546]|nr:hypothetical protein BR93DRAFT_655509 [Coniochaeta sp. PMI_546]
MLDGALFSMIASLWIACMFSVIEVLLGTWCCSMWMINRCITALRTGSGTGKGQFIYIYSYPQTIVTYFTLVELTLEFGATAESVSGRSSIQTVSRAQPCQTKMSNDRMTALESCDWGVERLVSCWFSNPSTFSVFAFSLQPVHLVCIQCKLDFRDIQLVELFALPAHGVLYIWSELGTRGRPIFGTPTLVSAWPRRLISPIGPAAQHPPPRGLSLCLRCCRKATNRSKGSER